MSALYSISEGDQAQRSAVKQAFPRITDLGAALQDLVVTAWVSAWRSSSHETLDSMPYSLQAPGYLLLDHTNEVADVGVMLSDYAQRRWERVTSGELLLCALLLHDIDKALLYERRDEEVVPDERHAGLPHGVLGAMLLKEVGLPDAVVTLVGTHAVASPVKSTSAEAWILHYADLFACDHAFSMQPGTVPFFQRS